MVFILAGYVPLITAIMIWRYTKNDVLLGPHEGKIIALWQAPAILAILVMEGKIF
jgi:hypothetical protein